MSSPGDQEDSQPDLETENFVTIRLLYHLWRIDSAARGFPQSLTEEVDLDVAKARWTIGLTLEMVRLPPVCLDVAHNSTARAAGVSG